MAEEFCKHLPRFPEKNVGMKAFEDGAPVVENSSLKSLKLFVGSANLYSKTILCTALETPLSYFRVL